MDYSIMYLETKNGTSVMEFKKESLTSNLNDLINELMGISDSFELYESCTNVGGVGCLAKVVDGEIVYTNNQLYREYFA